MNSIVGPRTPLMDTNNDTSHNYSNFSCADIVAAYRTWHNDLTTYASVRTLFGLVYAVIFVSGLFSNCLVVLTVVRSKSLQTVRNFFIINLSVSDIIVAFTSLIMTPLTAFLKNWYFGVAFCNLLAQVQGTSICVSTMTLTSIAIDRYILICHPHRRPIQRSKALLMVSSIWILGVAVGLPNATHMQVEEMYGYCGVFCQERWQRKDLRKLYGFAVLFVQFIIPFIVISFCYGCVFLQVKARYEARRMRYNNNTKEPSSVTAHSKTPQMIQRELKDLHSCQRINRMLVAMCAIFALTWSPSVLFNILRDAEAIPLGLEMQDYFISTIFHCLAMTTTVINPVLYAWMNEEFRKSLLRILNITYVSRASRRASDVNGDGRVLRIGEESNLLMTVHQSPPSKVMDKLSPERNGRLQVHTRILKDLSNVDDKCSMTGSQLDLVFANGQETAL